LYSQKTKSPNKAHIITAIGFMAALYAFSYIQRTGIPGTIFNEIQSDMKMTAEQVTYLSGIYLFIYASMQIITGGLVDRFGPSRIILAGGTLLSIGSLLFPLSSNIPMLYASRALVGLGGSLMYLSIIKELDVRFSDHRFSVLLSMMILSGYSGGLFATKPLEIAVRNYGWRESLLVVAIACSLTTIGAGLAFRNNTYVKKFQKGSEILDALKSVSKNPMMYAVTYACAVSFMVFFLMQGVIGKKMLEDCCKMTSATAASTTFFMMLTSMTASVLTGVVSTAIGNRRRPLMIAVTVASVLGTIIAILLIHGNSSLAIPFAVLIGIGSAGAPIFAASVKELNLPNFAATSVGVMNGSVYILITVVSIMSGRILDLLGKAKVISNTVHYGMHAYQVILVVCLVFATTGVLAALLAKETSGINIHTKAPIKSDII